MISTVSSNISEGTKSTEISSQNATITKISATLGREATIKCQAENLVDQKMVAVSQFPSRHGNSLT